MDPLDMNLFRGFGPHARLLDGDTSYVAELLRPWRLIGVELCEGDNGK
jgi:hypothetical protein